MNTTKTFAGAIGAVIVIGLLVLVFMQRMRQPQYPVRWSVAPAADPATQQAEQQIHSEMDQWNDGLTTGDPQKVIATLAPNFALYTQSVRGGPAWVDYTHDQFKAVMLSDLPTRRAGWRKFACKEVSGCTVSGNIATLTTGFGPGKGVTVTLVNTGGQWLISSLVPPTRPARQRV